MSSAPSNAASELSRIVQSPLFVLPLLWIVYVIHGLDRSVLLVLLDPIRREYNLSDSAIGLLSGIGYAVPFAIAGIPLGMLADRVNRARMLASMLALWSAATLLAGFTRNFLSLFLARCAVGACESGGPPAILSLITDITPARFRPAMVSLLFTAPYAGTAAGSLLGGTIAAHHGWRAALVAASVPGFLMALVLFASLREPRRGQAAAPPPARHVLPAILATPDLAVCILGIIAGAFVMLAMIAWTPTFLMRTHAMPIKQAGHVTAIALGLGGGAGTVIGGLLVTQFARGLPGRSLLGAGLSVLLSIPFGYLALLTRSPGTATLALTAWSFIASLYLSPAYSIMLGAAPAHIRGSVAAAAATLTNLIGAAFGPELVGLASDALHAMGDAESLRHALSAAMALSLAPAALFIRLARR